MEFGLPKMIYTDNTSKALSYLLPRREVLTDLAECVYRVEAEILQAGPEGVLLRNKCTGSYLLSGEGEASLARLLDALPEPPGVLTLHQQAALPLAEQRFPHAAVTPLTLYRYPTLEPPRFPLPFEVWPLDQGDIAEALTYDPQMDADGLRQQIQRKRVYGACIDDRLAGTVGTSPEGGISYLSVRPDLRGQGIGVTLLRYMLRKELQNGHVPYLLLGNSPLAPLVAGAGFVPVSGGVWRLTW